MNDKENAIAGIDLKNMSMEDVVKMLAGSMVVQNDKNNTRFAVIEAKVELLEEKYEKHDKAIMKQITLTTAEKTAVTSNVADRCKKLCKEFNLEEDIFVGMVRRRIYSCLKRKYSVSSYMEIPSFFFDDVLLYIQTEPIDCSDIRGRYIKKLQHQQKYDELAKLS